MEAAAAQATDQAIEYYQHHQKRMKSKEARRRHESVGSGAIESTCRQSQCRMKRCGQFWSTAGDAALLCLEMFGATNAGNCFSLTPNSPPSPTTKPFSMLAHLVALALLIPKR
jgi:hypothetical protein